MPRTWRFRATSAVFFVLFCFSFSLAQQPTLHIPLPKAYNSECLQRPHGSFSHNSTNTEYAIDLDTSNTDDEVIVAAQSGTAYVFPDQNPGQRVGFGNHINIDHGPVAGDPQGRHYFTTYAHLKTFLVSTGSTVQRGQPIGMEDNTGFSSGHHVHFGLQVGDPAQPVGRSSSVRAEHVITRENSNEQFRMFNTEQFVVNRFYESDNALPSACVNKTSWNFGSDSQCWTFGPDHNGDTIGFNAPGAWIIRIGLDPYVISPPISVEAARYRTIEISMDSLANNRSGEIFFTTESSPDFSPDKSVQFVVVNGGRYIPIPVDMRTNPQWRGRITRIRIDPAADGNGEALGIQWIRITENVVVPPNPVGTVAANATLNGQPWSGSVDYTITGPQGPIIGLAVPGSTSNVLTGQYTLRYNSGGPEGLINITPSSTQSLSANSTITFTMNFGAVGGVSIPHIHDLRILSSPVPGREFPVEITASDINPSTVRLVVTGPGCPDTNFGSCSVPNNVLQGVTETRIASAPLTLGQGEYLIYLQNGTTGEPSNGWEITVGESTSPLSITTQSPLPDGTVGNSYSRSFAASGGTPPYLWSRSVSGGSTPAGMTLSSNGVLSGVPTVGGTYSFTVVVVDAVGNSTQKPFTVTIRPNGPEVSAVSLTSSPGQPVSVRIDGSGFDINNVRVLILGGSGCTTTASCTIPREMLSDVTASRIGLVPLLIGADDYLIAVENGYSGQPSNYVPLNIATGTEPQPQVTSMEKVYFGAPPPPTPPFPSWYVRIEGSGFTFFGTETVVVGPSCQSFGSCVLRNIDLRVYSEPNPSRINLVPLGLPTNSQPGTYQIFVRNGQRGRPSNGSIVTLP